MKHAALLIVMGMACSVSACSSGDDEKKSNAPGDGDPKPALERESLPLGTRCDGSPETVFDQQLLERVDCGDAEAGPILPSARLESAPRTTSPYEAKRCTAPVAEQSRQELFSCFETEFWLAFSDGRLAAREAGLERMSAAIDRANEMELSAPDDIKALSRLYQLRGMFYMALGIENGEWEYLAFAKDWGGADFARVSELEPGNFVAAAFDITLDMALAQIAGEHERAATLAQESLDTALTAGDPDVIEPVNVGSIFAVTGVTMNYPLTTGLPQRSLDAQLEIGCIDEVEFCKTNTPHAPYARPGLTYHLAEMYARVGDRDSYIEQLEKVAQQPGYADWAWYDVVELQRAQPDLLLQKFASYGDDDYADSYAGMNNGCVMCHGRI